MKKNLNTMKKTLLLLLFFICNVSIGQQIVNAINKGTYNYFPKTVFSDSTSGVLYTEIELDNSIDKKHIVLYWISVCNHGYYQINLTPEQIYFTITHENPIPNKIFWIIDIDTIQYTKIKNGLLKQLPSRFIDYSNNYKDKYVFNDTTYKDNVATPKKWTEKELFQFEETCNSLIFKQLKEYSTILNSYINDSINPVVIPFVIDNKKAKYYSWLQEDLDEWSKLSKNNK